MSSILKVSEIQDPTNGNTALTIDSAGNVASAGAVVQMQFASNSTAITITTNNSYVDVVTLNFTPKFSTSKLFIMYTIQGVQVGTNTNSRLTPRGVRDGSTYLWTSNANFWTVSRNDDFRHGGWAYNHYDTPNTTNQITYKLQAKYDDPGSGGSINKDSNSGGSSIAILEIAQ